MGKKRGCSWRRYLLLFVVLVMSLLCGQGALAAESTVELHYGGTLNYDYANAVAALVNQERASAGVSALTQTGDMQQMAMVRAMELALYYSHKRPDGTEGMDIMQTSGTWGENIAAGQTSSSGVMQSWMNSSGHKANILNSAYKQIGVGCFYANGTYYWVQLFRSKTNGSGTVLTGTAGKAIAVQALPSYLSLCAIKLGGAFTDSSVELSSGVTESVLAVNKNQGGSVKWPLVLYGFSPGLQWQSDGGFTVSIPTDKAGALLCGTSCGSSHTLTLKCGTQSFRVPVEIAHNPESGTNCTKDIKCTGCGTVLEAKSGHAVQPYSAATCTQYTNCTKCGERIPPVGHRPDREADCTHSSVCRVCGTVIQAAYGHTWGDGNCHTYLECTKCGASGPRGDHTWSEWRTAGSGSSAYRMRYCLVCRTMEQENLGSGTSASTGGSSAGSSAGTSSGTSASTGGSTSSAKKKVTSVKITGKKSVLAGKKITLKAAVSPSNAANKAVTWSVSNKKYASISKKGVLTAKSAGAGKTVTVTAKAKDGSGKKATFKVKIKGAVSKITLKGAKTLKAGKKTTLKAAVKVGKGGSKALKWTTSNKKYATVSSKGVVKALKAGKGKTVTITAKAKDGSGKKATIKIKIK